MKPYGHKKYDTLACNYGCCVSKYGKQRNSRKKCDQSRRKTARQSGKSGIFTQLIEGE